jgi:hypothetical protein
METKYIATDLEFSSETELAHIVPELGDWVQVHLNQWVDDTYQVVVGITLENDTPESAVSSYCDRVEMFSDQAMFSWEQCDRRVIDIAFEGGNDPKSVTYELPPNLLLRTSKLGLALAVTIYRVGTYSGDPTP